SPSDIDLLRLLTLSDVVHQWGFAYDDITQQIIRPANGTPGDYTGYDGMTGETGAHYGYEVLRDVLHINSEFVAAAPEAYVPRAWCRRCSRRRGRTRSSRTPSMRRSIPRSMRARR